MAFGCFAAVLVTAVCALLAALLVSTDITLKLSVALKTPAPNAYRFMANPMFLKEVHPFVLGIKINSREQLKDPPRDYYNITINEELPLIGTIKFVNEIWMDAEALTITNLAFPLWGLLTSKVQWQVKQLGEPGEENCVIEENSVIRAPWALKYYVESELKRVHMGFLNKAKSTLERLTEGPTAGQPNKW